MSIWNVDADALELDDINISLVYKNKKIDSFITDEDFRFISATKGWGKTFLLKVKRKMLQNQGYICIPYNKMVDSTLINFSFNKRQITFLSDCDNWKTIWSISIIISVIKNLYSYYKDKNKKSPMFTDQVIEQLCKENDVFKSLCENNFFYTPCDFLNNILNRGNKELSEMFNFYSMYLIPMFKKMDTPVAIFIDSIDEAFRDHIYAQDVSLTAHGNISEDIWYFSQLGLLEAAFHLNKTNKHIKVFSSLRKQAASRWSDDNEMLLQIRSTILDLTFNYDYDDLKKMFKLYIINEKDENLYEKKMKSVDPDYAFTGLKQIDDSYIKEKSEPVFDYFYRHTLKRPRDVMAICSKINLVDINNRTQENVKTIVNNVSQDIARQYIEECKPFIKDVKIKELFTMLDTNILTFQKLKTICREYNDRECTEDECANCELKHPFCTLYNIGLLGIVHQDIATNIQYQHFLSPGETILNPSNILPRSDYFFIHPCLNSWIKKINHKYYLSQKVIVGNGKKWDDNIILNKAKIFISYSRKDAKYLKDNSLIGYLKILETEGIADFWYDNKVDVGDDWDREIRKQIEASHIAMVLVTNNFLRSTYCQNEEVKLFLKLRKEKGLKIIPIIISACEWQNYEWLSSINCMPADNKTLEGHYPTRGKRDELFLNILKRLKKVIKEC